MKRLETVIASRREGKPRWLALMQVIHGMVFRSSFLSIAQPRQENSFVSRQLLSVKETITEIVRRGANGVWQLGLIRHHNSTQFARYAELLVEWNATRMNLTRLTSLQDIAVKHFLDSLAVLTAVSPLH